MVMRFWLFVSIVISAWLFSWGSDDLFVMLVMMLSSRFDLSYGFAISYSLALFGNPIVSSSNFASCFSLSCTLELSGSVIIME
jgi:hypothetical protein